MTNKVIVKPIALKGIKRKKVLYIPFDSTDKVILNSFKKRVLREQNLGYGHIFLLEDRIILYQSIGAPAAVLALESLIASGTKEIIILGICGSLNSQWHICDAAIINKAFSEEGTSRHYFPRRKIFWPSPALKEILKEKLRKKNLPFDTGALVSTDAPFRETKPWLARMQERGMDFVDMETSAVFALAEYRQIEASALMIISDELYHKKWKPGFFYSRLKKRLKDYFLPFIL